MTVDRWSGGHSATWPSGRFELLQYRCSRGCPRVDSVAREFTGQPLHQLVGRCRNAVCPAEQHDLTVEVVRLNVAGTATQALLGGPTGSGVPGDLAKLEKVSSSSPVLFHRCRLQSSGRHHGFTL